jgi:hypothetical protein
VAQLKKELENTDSVYDTEKLSERIAKLSGALRCAVLCCCCAVQAWVSTVGKGAGETPHRVTLRSSLSSSPAVKHTVLRCAVHCHIRGQAELERGKHVSLYVAEQLCWGRTAGSRCRLPSSELREMSCRDERLSRALPCAPTAVTTAFRPAGSRLRCAGKGLTLPPGAQRHSSATEPRAAALRLHRNHTHIAISAIHTCKPQVSACTEACGSTLNRLHGQALGVTVCMHYTSLNPA